MNLLMITPYFSPAVGGVETHLNDLCKYLISKKHKVFVRTYKALGVKERGRIYEESKYLKIHRLPWPDFNLIFKLEKYPVLKFIYIFSGIFLDCLIFLLRNYKNLDVIQAHGFIAAMIGVLLGKIFKKRVVVNTHVAFKLNDNFMTKIIKWTLLNSDKILVLTQGIKASLIKIRIPADKIKIYHYWVDQKVFNKQKNSKKKLGWENKFVALFVGRLIEVKGINIIFDLARILKNITFAIVGSGPLGEEIKQKSKEYSNILFLGKVKNKDLPIYYSGADLLLIPSRIFKQEYEEGIPRVMIEALSCSLPIISTRAGGIPDVFNDEIGLLVDDDSKSMMKAIENFYQDKSLLKLVVRKCRLYALKYFTLTNAKIIEKSLIPG